MTGLVILVAVLAVGIALPIALLVAVMVHEWRHTRGLQRQWKEMADRYDRRT